MAPTQHVESSDGVRIAYRTSGSGEPILFVHGAGTSGADWLFVKPFLEDRFTVVTMDRRGRGASADRPEYSMEREADDVLAVLDATGANLLVGHSYGALCSILAAERGANLRRLVLYEPPIAVTEDSVRGLDELVERGEHATVLTGFLGAVGTTPEQLEAIQASPAWPVLLDAVPTLPRELGACTRWRNPTGPIEVPTLFLIGADTDGPAYLDTLDELLEAFPDLRRESLPGQRHVAHVFAAERFAQLVADFCGQREPSGHAER